MAENYFDQFDQQPKVGNFFDQFDEKPEAPKRTALAVANDTVIEAANAVAGGVSAAANFVKPGNAVSKFIDDKIIKAGEEAQSDVTKAAKTKFRDEVEGADGVGGELKAVGSYVLENPLLSAAQAAGSFVGPGAAIKGAGAAARAVGAGAKGVERAGLAGGAAAGAAMAGGDAAGTAYDLASKAGATEEQATAAGRQASVIPAAVGAAGSLIGAERLVAGAKGFGGGALARAGKTAVVEAAQEGFEEGITQYEGQRAAMPFDPTIDPTKGVAAAAGMGAALGGITGGGVSLLTGGHGGDAAPAPAAAPLLLSNEPNPLVAFPDGTVGRQSEIDAYLASLPEDQRAATRARMMGLSPEAVPPAPVPYAAGAEDARRSAITRLNELNQQERGELPVAQVAPPDGAAVLAQQREAQEAVRQAELEASRAVTDPDDEILQSIGAADAPPARPSQVMGLDPTAGPLSSAAVVAVDSGASQELAAQAALRQAAEPAKERGDAEPVRLDLSAERLAREQLVDAHAADLQERLDFLQQQGRASGWDARLIAERERVQEELAALGHVAAAPRPAPATVKEGIARARARRGAPKVAASAPVVVPAEGDAMAPGAVTGRPRNWRTNALQARKVAKSLGIEAGDMRTPQIVAAIDARDARVQLDEQGDGNAEAARGLRVADDSARGVAGTAQDAAGRTAGGTQSDDAPAARGGDTGGVVSTVPEAVPDAARAGERQPALNEGEQAAPAAAVDAAANEAATSPHNDVPEPTQAQKDAGNYKLGHLSGPGVQGLRISIENPQGSTRSGTSPDGKAWSNMMAAHYGYVKGTEAADGDHVDVFVGPHAATAPTVFVVDQINADGSYDEAKALFGFNSEAEAVAAYKGSYDADWKVGPITAMSVDEFKAGLTSNRFKRPLSPRLEAAVVATPPTAAAERDEKIVDFGEKIGGARKDRAEKMGRRATAAAKDARPAWARRFLVSQIAKSKTPGEEGRWVIRDTRSLDWMKQPRQVGRDSFATREAAEAAIPLAAVSLKHRAVPLRDGKYEIWRDVTDRKRVKVVEQTFDTREDALRYMAEHAQAIIETNSTFGEADLPRPATEERAGPARREGDVKDSDFTSTFGFRGVEFGNWNNQTDRQQLLNDAYDGLVDLAEVVGIPPRAISLNGELALAFGARGSGLSGARAHYEPDKTVINLTKMNGAGSLAHEWFHAMDHYFGRQDGKASAEWVIDKDGTRSLKVSNAFERDAASGGLRGERSGVRAEVREAYESLMRTIARKAEGYVDDTAQADRFVARAREGVERRLGELRAGLAQQLDTRYFKRNNKPASAEQLAEFDTVAQRILDGQALDMRVESKGRGVLSGVRWTNDALEQLSVIAKAVRGRSGFQSDGNGSLDRLRSEIQLYASRLKMLAEAQSGNEKTRMVPTQFAMDAKELDQGRGTDYWTTPHEMAARAFQGYVEDRIAERGGVSPFLNYGPENVGIPTPWGVKRPFPHGAERAAINLALDRLVSVIQTREGEGGNIALFRRSDDGTAGLPAAVANAMRALSRPTYSPQARMQAVATVQKTVEAIRAAWANSPDIVVAFDMGDPVVPDAARRADLKQRSGGARGAPEGFYYRGKAYLMASRLPTAQDAARVLYHEVLGHHGLRGRFGKQLDGVLNQVATMRRAEVDAKIREYGLRGVNKLDRRAAAEEVLAEMAQRTPELHFVRRAVAAIRSWLRQHVPGFRGMRLTDDEIIRNFILPARKFVERGTGAGAQASALAFSRVDDATPPQRSASNFSEARTAAKAFQGSPLLNTETGMQAVVSRNSLDKMLSAKAVGKSATPAAHSLAVANLDTLFERAVLGWTKPDREGDSNIRAVHRFFVPMTRNGRELLVKLTVKETAIERDPNPLYTVEAVDFNEKSPAAQWVAASADTDGIDLTSIRSAGEVLSLAEQIERGNAAAGNGEGLDIMFSRSRVADFTRAATAELNRAFSAPGTLSWWHKTVGTMYNLAERSPAFKPVFDAAQGFVDDVSYFANDAAELAPKLLPKLETWRDIKKSPVAAADNRAVAKPVFEGTLTWARDEQGEPVQVQTLVDAAAGLSADQKAQRLLRNGHIDERMLKAWKGMPLESYEKAVGTRFESRMLQPGVVWSDAELRSMFQLTDGQIALYREFRQSTDRSLDTMARADMLRFAGEDAKGLRGIVMDAPDAQAAAVLIRDHLVQLASDQPDRATMLLNTANGIIERADKVRDLQARGYAPLSRFGRFTVDVVDSSGERQYFGLFETVREANAMAVRMREEFGEAGVSQGTLSEEAFKLFAGVTPETLELFGNALGLDSTGDSAQDQAFQEYLKLTKTNRSAMRRLIHRKGTAGFSNDVGRVLAAFVYSNARQTAAGLHMGDLGEAMTAIPKEQGELKDAAVRLAEYVKNPQEEAQAVRGFLFAQYLGGSVASALVNALQPVQVTFPWLSQYGGANAAAAQIGRAAKDLAARGRNYEPDLAAALKRAEAEGVVAPQEVHQLMAQARGAGSLRSGDGTRTGDLRALGQNALLRVSLAWGKVFGAAEQLNRRITFIAAYRTAKAQGMADPSEFARQAITETQFLYSKANKMEWGRGAVGGTLMTFKTYSVAYLELLHRMYTQGGPEGKRAAMLALGMLLLMGGVGGLPFAEDLEDAADGLAQMMGYNFSAKKTRQEFLESMLPRGITQFIDKGVSGLPGAPLDVSGRLGLGNLIPGTGLLLEKTSHAHDVLEIVGPAGDLASRILSGGRSVLTGDVGAGLLEMSPAAVRNAAKGADMAATGMYRDAKGYKVLDTNTLEAALKSIGFQPNTVATIQEANRISQGAKAFYNLRAQEIRALWAQGIFEGDPEKVAAAREQVAVWNRRNPDQLMLIEVPDIMRRVREMRKSKDQRIADTAPRALRQQLREDLARVRQAPTA